MTAPAGPGPSPEAIRTAMGILRRLGERAVTGGPLGPLTTYRVGGPAAVRVVVLDEDELTLAGEAAGAAGLPVLVVGRGSNLLVADAGFGGLAVLLDADAFGRVTFDAASVTAGAAVALPVLARQTVEAALTGFEWAVGVPGSVGGAVRMNAGGHGSDVARTLSGARVFDLLSGEAGEWPTERLAFSYRHSSVAAHHVVLSARFGLAAADPEPGRQTIREIVRWRREHQPGGQNAGSVFTNPPDDSAGRLIEACGLKGCRIGTAMVSTKHANFIQADPGGSADDVHRLMAHVRGEVERIAGVGLTREVRLIGFEDEPSTGGSGSVEEER